MPHVSYIEFNVPDVRQAAEFYKRVLGWDARGWGGDQDYLVSQHGEEPGIDAGIRKAPDGKPQAVAVITVPRLTRPWQPR